MKNSIVFSFFVLSLLAFAGCERKGEFVKPEHIHWDYENPNWDEEGFSDCIGAVQSPVNINTNATVLADLDSITFNYTNFTMKIIDNGHTIQVNCPPSSSIRLNGTEFTSLQFHFHHHSEHQINDTPSPMELHLVHKDTTTGNLTVLGIMLQGGGAANPFIDSVWANIPAEEEVVVTTGVTLNLMEILPANKNYYTYTGSLTTPPCSQIVQWIVFKEPVAISQEQIDAFGMLYPDNFRPLQDLNNRHILEKR